MRLLCEACGRTLPPGGFRVEGATLRLACAGCGVEAAFPPPDPVASVVSVASAASVASADSVASAASVASAVSVGPAASVAAGAPSGPSPAAAAGGDWLEARWAAVQQSWADPLAHDRLITEAVARDALAELGRRYADHLARSPGDGAARRAREELVRRAAAHLLTQLPVEEKGFGPQQARQVQVVMVVLIALATLAFAVFVLRGIGR